MSQPSLELTVEVNIFEHLEQVTNLTLGDLTKLRLKSRTQQINLLFLAYHDGQIDAHQANQIAVNLGINTQFAPWVGSSSSLDGQAFPDQRKLPSYNSQAKSSQLPNTHSSNSTYTGRKKFGERASLTEAIQQASQEHLSDQKVELSKLKKRQFADSNLKTSIEINLPSFIEESHTPFDAMSSNIDAHSHIYLGSEQDYHNSSSIMQSIHQDQWTQRWTQLRYQGRQNYFGKPIHRYQAMDLLLKSKIELSSTEQIQNMEDIVELKQVPNEYLVGIYQLLHTTIYPYSLLGIGQTQNQNLVYRRMVPSGTSLDIYYKHLSSNYEPSQQVNKMDQVKRLVYRLLQEANKISELGLVHRLLEPSCINVEKISLEQVPIQEPQLDYKIFINHWESALNLKGSMLQDTGFRSNFLTEVERKLSWRAPELSTQDSLSPSEWVKADVYSISAIVYWLFTNTTPPSSQSSCHSVLSQHLSPHHVRLVDLCVLGLHNNPQNRPSLKDLFEASHSLIASH